MMESLAVLFLVFLAIGMVLRLLSFRKGTMSGYGPLAFGFTAALATLALHYWAAPMLASEEGAALTPLVHMTSSLPMAAVAFAAFVIADLVVTWWADTTGFNYQDDP